MNGSTEERDPPLMVKNAKYITGKKVKVDGQLTVSLHSLSWKPLAATEAESFRIKVSAITGALQRAKGKPMMRVPLQSSAHAFELERNDDLDAIIEIMTSLMENADHKGKGPALTAHQETLSGPFADAKKQLLAQDADLRSLFRQLVEGGLLSEAEFWSSRQAQLQAGRRSTGEQSTGSGASTQRPGLASAMLPEVKRLDNGKMSLTLTAELQAQIFKEKPWVAAAFQELVPSLLQPHAFWEQYVSSELARKERRKRKAAGHDVVGGEDDIFARFRKAITAPQGKRVRGVDPTVNVAADNFDRLAPGFGLSHKATLDADVVGRMGNEDLSFPAEINRHGAVVLGVAAADPTGPDVPSDRGRGDGEAAEGWEMRAGSALEDLRQPAPSAWEPLSIRDPRSYFQVGKHSQAKSEGHAAASDTLDSIQGLVNQLMGLREGPLQPGMSGASALAVLSEASQVAPQQNGSSAVPASQLGQSLLAVVRGEVLKGNEMLRHLWACFPLNSTSRQAKADRLTQALSQIYDSLKRLQEECQGPQRSTLTRLAKPLQQAVDAALAHAEAERGK
eukprot:jgi/Botrbrau1/2065/Bobra.0047s0030.1